MHTPFSINTGQQQHSTCLIAATPIPGTIVGGWVGGRGPKESPLSTQHAALDTKDQRHKDTKNPGRCCCSLAAAMSIPTKWVSIHAGHHPTIAPIGECLRTSISQWTTANRKLRRNNRMLKSQQANTKQPTDTPNSVVRAKKKNTTARIGNEASLANPVLNLDPRNCDALVRCTSPCLCIDVFACTPTKRTHSS